MPVDTPSPEYEAALPRWQRCRDCFEGSDAVLRGGTRIVTKVLTRDNPG